MELKQEILDDIVILHLTNAIFDRANQTILYRKVDSLVSNRTKKIILDFSKVKGWVEYSILTELDGCKKITAANNVEIKLSGIYRVALLFFNYLTQNFSFYENTQQAIDSFKK